MRASLLATSTGMILAAAIGCALGTEQEPGCHVDAECGEGWTCRAGACFQATTGQPRPVVDGGDAGGDDAG